MPDCALLRVSILTVRYPFRHGIVGNPTPDHGYATTCIGKGHLGHIPEYLPIKSGFDFYLGILYSNDMRPVQFVEDRGIE